MSNTTFGPGAKKETVYGGPGPQPSQGAASTGAALKPAVDTIYNGGAPGNSAGTVYNGPGTGSTYNPAPPNPAARPLQPATNAGGAKAGGVFFLIAGFSVINTLLILGKAPFVFALGLAITRVSADTQLGPVLLLNAVAIGVFVVLGIFAARGAKAAFLIGLLLYGGDTALLLLSDNLAVHFVSIACHGIFLFSIFKGFRQLS